MKSIVGTFLLNNTDHDLFYKKLNSSIKQLQEDGQEVEIQYTTNLAGDKICQNALIIGRK